MSNINDYLQNANLGYSVMAAKDFNKDSLFIKDDKNRLYFDPNDDFVFSNHEKIIGMKGEHQQIPNQDMVKVSEIKLENFDECITDLTETHKIQLEKFKTQITNADKIQITGFADESIPTPDCLIRFPDGNPQIALARARSVATYLMETFGVNALTISASAGIPDYNRTKCPECRKVFITILSQGNRKTWLKYD